MAKFMLNLSTDNAAFEEDGGATEIARILREVADRIDREGLSGLFETIRDINGNDVGRFTLKPDDYK